MADLAQLVKAYDIRGVVPDQLDAELAREVGAAFVELTGSDAVVVARDMRASSPALAEGATGRGADVVDAGMGSTDYLYYASGALELPGAMFTASHNPAAYNGIKLCRAGAAPVGQDTGLGQIRAWLEHGLPPPAAARGKRTGRVVQRDLLPDYAAYLRRLVDLSGNRRLTVVVDAGNGMAGHTVPVVLAGLPVELVPLYFELDGSFPNHEANPIEPENLVDVQQRVRETVAVLELAKHPGSAVVHNVITSQAVPEIIVEHGGRPVRTRVGHSFIKQIMAETGAVFGGEHSGHYYFRDFWRADTGMLTAMHVLAALGEQDRPLSELVAAYSRYAASGEINSEVDDVAAMLARVEGRFAGAEADHLGGVNVRLPGRRWFNLRPSNTEPLLRLNVEAPDRPAMEALRDEVLAVVRA